MQHTTNYNLDMPEGNDQLSVMVNYNGNLQKIDTAIKTVEDKADAGSTDIEDLSATVDVLENNVTAVNTRLASAEADITAVDDKADAIEVKADNALAGLQTKQNTITGAASTITSTNLTTSRALVSDASGKVSVSNVTATELGRLSGVTGNVQSQISSLSSQISSARTWIKVLDTNITDSYTSYNYINGINIANKNDISIAVLNQDNHVLNTLLLSHDMFVTDKVVRIGVVDPGASLNGNVIVDIENLVALAYKHDIPVTIHLKMYVR